MKMKLISLLLSLITVFSQIDRKVSDLYIIPLKYFLMITIITKANK